MKISVIIPTFNREKTICRSIQSVLKQTQPVDEIIVVDDCGTDQTKDVVLKMISELPAGMLRYVKLEENGGPAHARNYGVSIAAGDWIAFHDSDDEWYPVKMEKQLDYLKEHPGTRFVYSAYEMDFAEGIVPLNLNMERYEGDMLPILLRHNTVGAPTMLMEKSLFEEVGGFDESMRALEDWDFAIKVSKTGVLGFVPEPLMRADRVDRSVSYKAGHYFQYSCQLIARYLTDYQQYQLFDTVVTNLYHEAKQYNLASQIEKMLMLYLSMR